MFFSKLRENTFVYVNYLLSVESLSIEETNKLRAKLGLAPLELEDKQNTEPVEKEDGSGEKVIYINFKNYDKNDRWVRTLTSPKPSP